jgi:hypothetical protein
MAFGRRLANDRLALHDFEVTYLAAEDQTSLRAQLRGLGRRRYHAIVAVGHSNASGIRAARDAFLSWTDFARALRKLRPEKLMLIACQAGALGVAQAFFETIGTLRRVYGCPLNLPSNQASAVLHATPLILGAFDLTDGIRMLLQGVHLLANDGVFFEHRREEFANADTLKEAEGKTALGVLAKFVLRAGRDQGPVFA